MSFYSKYELERLIADGEVKTFRAKENATGRPVLLHMFQSQGQDLLAGLKARLAQDPRRPSPPLIELGEFAGAPYAVTEAFTPFRTLREWLERPAPAAASDEFEKLFGAPKPATPPPAPQTQGEFTKFFGSAPGPSPPPAAPAPQTQGEFTKFFGSAPGPSPPPAAPAPQTQGEFTKFFGSAPGPSPPPAAPAPQTPGEFTRMFGAAKPAAVPPPAPSTPPLPETGQFTRLFGSGPSGESIDIEQEQARAAQSAVPESRPFPKPSEFTRVFGPQQRGPQAPPRPLTIGSASGIFKAPSAPEPAKAPAENSPGEYTRLIGRPGDPRPAPQAPPPPPPVTPVPVPAARRAWMVAAGVGAALLLLAMFVLLAMVAQRK